MTAQAADVVATVMNNDNTVLRHCWLGGSKGIWPVKKSGGVLVWLSLWSMAQLMPLPLTVCCFSKIQIGFTFLVPAHLRSPGKRAVKRVCVCVLDYNTHKYNVLVAIFHVNPDQPIIHCSCVFCHTLVPKRKPRPITKTAGHFIFC